MSAIFLAVGCDFPLTCQPHAIEITVIRNKEMSVISEQDCRKRTIAYLIPIVVKPTISQWTTFRFRGEIQLWVFTFHIIISIELLFHNIDNIWCNKLQDKQLKLMSYFRVVRSLYCSKCSAANNANYNLPTTRFLKSLPSNWNTFSWCPSSGK